MVAKMNGRKDGGDGTDARRYKDERLGTPVFAYDAPTGLPYDPRRSALLPHPDLTS
jgi:hypothetical protein